MHFYSSTATFVWSRNTVRDSSHLLSSVAIGENIHRGADRFAWVTCGSPSSLERPAEHSALREWPADLCIQSKITDLILSLKFHKEKGKLSLPYVFSVYCWLLELTYLTLLFFFGNLFDLICEQKYLSFYTQAINYTFYLSCETTLLMLSCDRIKTSKFIPAHRRLLS